MGVAYDDILQAQISIQGSAATGDSFRHETLHMLVTRLGVRSSRNRPVAVPTEPLSARPTRISLTYVRDARKTTCITLYALAISRPTLWRNAAMFPVVSPRSLSISPPLGRARPRSATAAIWMHSAPYVYTYTVCGAPVTPAPPMRGETRNYMRSGAPRASFIIADRSSRAELNERASSAKIYRPLYSCEIYSAAGIIIKARSPSRMFVSPKSGPEIR